MGPHGARMAPHGGGGHGGPIRGGNGSSWGGNGPPWAPMGPLVPQWGGIAKPSRAASGPFENMFRFLHFGHFLGRHMGPLGPYGADLAPSPPGQLLRSSQGRFFSCQKTTFGDFRSKKRLKKVEIYGW